MRECEQRYMRMPIGSFSLTPEVSQRRRRGDTSRSPENTSTSVSERYRSLPVAMRTGRKVAGEACRSSRGRRVTSLEELSSLEVVQLLS